MITWLFPVIGHVGICDSRGRVWDFQGPYNIGVDGMAFGRPMRVSCCISDKLDVLHDRTIPALWDNAIIKGSRKFSHKFHNFFTNNCHHHVAECLNNFKLNDKENYNQVDVAVRVFFKGKYVSFAFFFLLYENLFYRKCKFFSHLSPFFLILLIIAVVVLAIV
jgi:hypothetical protein